MNDHNTILPDILTDETKIFILSTASEQLLEFWKKGQTHLNNLWKIWYDEYILSLREWYQSKLKSARVQSHMTPKIGQIVHLKEDLSRGAW